MDIKSTKNQMRYLFILLLLPLLFLSCLNQEGEGGTGIVQGYVYSVMHHDDVLNFDVDTFPAAKTDVYIIYGDEAVYGDKMETAHDGFFEFRYLTKGTYRIYAFSSYSDGRKEAVCDTVQINRGGMAITNDLYIHEGKMLDKSYIKGTLQARYYNKDIPVTDYIPAYGERVYIRKKGAPFHFEDVRAGLEGTFMFQKLEVGIYEVFALTEDSKEVVSPVIREVPVPEEGVVVEIEEAIKIRINT